MRRRLLTAAAMAAMIMLSVPVAAAPYGPHRHEGHGRHGAGCVTTVVPAFRTVQTRNFSPRYMTRTHL